MDSSPLRGRRYRRVAVSRSRRVPAVVVDVDLWTNQMDQGAKGQWSPKALRRTFCHALPLFTLGSGRSFLRRGRQGQRQ